MVCNPSTLSANTMFWKGMLPAALISCISIKLSKHSAAELRKKKHTQEKCKQLVLRDYSVVWVVKTWCFLFILCLVSNLKIRKTCLMIQAFPATPPQPIHPDKVLGTVPVQDRSNTGQHFSRMLFTLPINTEHFSLLQDLHEMDGGVPVFTLPFNCYMS